MKKLFTYAFIFTAFGSFAQVSIEVTNLSDASVVMPNGVVTTTTEIYTKAEILFDIKNTSGSTKSYNVKRYDIYLNKFAGDTTEATAYFCFAGLCFGSDVMVSQTPITLNAGQSASGVQGDYQILHADLDEAGKVGFSHVKYTVINTSNAADSVQYSIKYNEHLDETSLESHGKELALFSVYPVPAMDRISVKFNSGSAYKGKMKVFNALGGLTIEKDLNVVAGANKIELDLTGLKDGIYIVNFSGDGNTVSRRIVLGH